MQYHEMTIAGCKRRLPICRVNDKMSIAAFIMFSDVEITIRTAEDEQAVYDRAGRDIG